MVTPMLIQSTAIPTRSLGLGRTLVYTYITAAGGILVVLLLLMLSSNEPEAGEGGMKGSMEVIQASVGGVDYFHCPRAGAGDASALDLVLLHGAHFTKNDWKSSGILDKLCQTPKLSVTALDLNSKASHEDLKNVLDSLRKAKIIQSKPVALVTPSASGYAIVDWISQSTIESLVKYVGYWIPVASPSISRAPDASLQGLKDRLPILAIYGSKDSKGKVVSEKLHTLSDAKLIQIQGGHPCYLDSPDTFTQELLDFLSL